jgi:predicted metal-dependent enzyme (double-stranded beta helix superfamily)
MSVLHDLIVELEACCRPGISLRKRAENTRAVLGARLATRGWLPRELQVPRDDDYSPVVLHVGEGGRYSLLTMTWLPGQQTPIHDHVTWCVVGMYRGEESSVGYTLHQEGPGDEHLVARRRDVWRAGDTELLVPPDEDIHQVSCTGPEVAVSIHVYGADIGALGSSINRRFDHLPVREEATSAAASWRAR